MSIEVEKVRFFDDRIVQPRPRYKIQQGALSVSSAPFASLAATPSQHTYQIIVPSQGVFLNRKLLWTSSCFFQYVVAAPPQGAVGDFLVVPGRDISLCAFPLHSLCQTLSASVGDATVTSNLSLIRETLTRLIDQGTNRNKKTGPSALDVYRSNQDAVGAINNPMAGWSDATSNKKVGNGAWGEFVFVDPTTGLDLRGDGSYTLAVGGVDVVFTYRRGIPTLIAAPPASGYPIYMRFASTEALQLSPFQYSDDSESSCGLFGLQNIAVTANMQSPENGRLLRQTTAYGRTITTQPQYWTPPGRQSCFSNSTILCEFLTPSLSVPLAPRSVVPWMETTAYTYPVQVPAGLGAPVASQTISIPQIPDYFIVTVRPQTYAPTDCTWYLPVQTVSTNFCNFSGLMSSLRQVQLYEMCVRNGLHMSYAQWIGRATTTSAAGVGSVQLTGGPLVIKPALDLVLQEGESPGLA
jgi:hypothetical protein